ncbi:alpha/beta fold hydrolase [Yinghuangia seranimata]|uniref:alpha/beta fold hydrolase n=1 Tax=Yinghuangia seranimata TaxID=408067 RepID=UPI00248B18B7|nr:alpha/beta hydrolase [Yinghuangia seranimata]MDI2131125.1 alpha/beta hydrolase [Yinghuangia seranimata]
MPELTVGNTRVPYRAQGVGPALVLVHGTGPGSVTWDAIAGRFTDRYTVLLPDLGGSERVEDDGGELTVEAHAEQLAAVIEHSGSGPAYVLGFSLGTAAAAALAATRPELVRRLILVAGPGHTRDAHLSNTFALWRGLADDPEAFARYAALLAFSRRHLNSISPEAVAETVAFMRPTPGVLRQLDLVRRLDVRDYLPKIQAETLVVGCTRDVLIPVEKVRELYEGIPGSTYTELDSGHVVRVEQPEEFARLVRDFLEPAAA